MPEDCLIAFYDDAAHTDIKTLKTGDLSRDLNKAIEKFQKVDARGTNFDVELDDSGVTGGFDFLL